MTLGTEQSEPHAFVHEELVRALEEQSFGITSYEVVSTSPLKATARVVLLEGEPILVSLTSRGFQCASPSDPPMQPDMDAEDIFETVEQFLQSVSPRYDAARRNALITKLDALASDVA